jgi:hypothetical protein
MKAPINDRIAFLLLVDWLWPSLEKTLGYELVIGIAAKDLVLVADKTDENQVKAMKQVMDEVHETGEFLLSRRVYTMTKHGLVVTDL